MAITGSSASATVSYPSSTNSGGYTYTSATYSATALLQSHFGTFAGGRVIDLAFTNTMSITAGSYWVGVLQRHSSSSANGGFNISVVGNAAALLNNIAMFGQASSAQTSNYTLRGALAGFGQFINTQSVIQQSVALSLINHGQTILPSITFLSS